MPKSMTEIVTEIGCLTGMELPTVWGNVRCIDRVGGVGWCNGTCDGVCDGVWLFGKDSFEECPLTLLLVWA